MSALPAARAETNFASFGSFGGGSLSYSNFSNDGSLIIGTSAFPGNTAFHAYMWRQGVITDLGTLGGTNSGAAGFSANGNVIVGDSDVTSNVTHHAFRFSNGVMQDLGSLGGSTSYARAVSSDGNIVAGESFIAGDTESHVFIWSNNTMIDLGTLGGTISSFGALSANGSVVAGNSTLVGDVNSHAFRWVNGTMTDLGTLGGTMSNFGALSVDGTVIAGDSTLAGDVDSHAFRWVNGTMTDLGTLGGSSSTFRGLSMDGNVVAGNSMLVGDIDSHAFHWVNGTMTDLGTLGGTFSGYRAMSADGAVIAGNSYIAGNAENHAFRWQNGVMQDLGTLGGTYSSVVNISANGAVIVGNSGTAGNAQNMIYRWDQTYGMRSLPDILTAAHVDYTGWNFSYTGFQLNVSDDGKLVIGIATLNGDRRIFLLNEQGVTTPEDMGQSLVTVSQAGNQAVAVTGLQLTQSLFQARNLIPSAMVATPVVAGGSSSELNDLGASAGGPYKTLWQMYTTGSTGFGQNNDFDNHDFNGTIGVKAQLTPSIAIGGGIIGSTGRSDLAFEGHSTLDAIGVSGIAAYAPPDNGLRLYSALFAANLDMDVIRGYRNGSGLDSSRGDTHGLAYGAAGQVGWNIPVTNRYRLMPYTELRWSKTELDGYNETGGAFAGNFSDQDTMNSSARLGIENNYLLKDNLNLIGRVAIAHRLNNQGSGVTANISGLTQTLGSEPGDKTWGEAAAGIGWQMNERTYLSGELNARSGDTPEPQLSATIGFSVRF